MRALWGQRQYAIKSRWCGIDTRRIRVCDKAFVWRNMERWTYTIDWSSPIKSSILRWFWNKLKGKHSTLSYTPSGVYVRHEQKAVIWGDVIWNMIEIKWWRTMYDEELWNTYQHQLGPIPTNGFSLHALLIELHARWVDNTIDRYRSKLFLFYKISIRQRGMGQSVLSTEWRVQWVEKIDGSSVNSHVMLIISTDQTLFSDGEWWEWMYRCIVIDV